MLATALLVLATPDSAQAFRILGVSTQLQEGVYRLDADIRYDLSEPVQDALANSVPLIIEVTLQVRRERDWLWNETIAELTQRYQFQYHALARQYVVTNLNSDAISSFPTREAAMEFMGRLRDFPLIDRSLLESDESYQVRLKVDLAIESLPAPLRPIAYLSSDWWLGSDWYAWPL
ncbi:MAG: DUF4390 domain-containing protein [Candidatus Competibacterales bacterium]|nr:DUF4390 domain-containing protein [Candidatus Competibacterales bacterium]